MCAIQNRVESIVFPVFGGGVGEVDAETAATFMWLGYRQIMHPNNEISWEIVSQMYDEWIELGAEQLQP